MRHIEIKTQGNEVVVAGSGKAIKCCVRPDLPCQVDCAAFFIVSPCDVNENEIALCDNMAIGEIVNGKAVSNS